MSQTIKAHITNWRVSYNGTETETENEIVTFSDWEEFFNFYKNAREDFDGETGQNINFAYFEETKNPINLKYVLSMENY